jgi:hypothetical protein
LEEQARVETQVITDPSKEMQSIYSEEICETSLEPVLHEGAKVQSIVETNFREETEPSLSLVQEEICTEVEEKLAKVDSPVVVERQELLSIRTEEICEPSLESGESSDVNSAETARKECFVESIIKIDSDIIGVAGKVGDFSSGVQEERTPEVEMSVEVGEKKTIVKDSSGNNVEIDLLAGDGSRGPEKVEVEEMKPDIDRGGEGLKTIEDRPAAEARKENPKAETRREEGEKVTRRGDKLTHDVVYLNSSIDEDGYESGDTIQLEPAQPPTYTQTDSSPEKAFWVSD